MTDKSVNMKDNTTSTENISANMENKTIIIADDSLISRKLINEIIAPLKCRVVMVKNGKETITQLLANKVSCLLLDLLMPDVNGFEVLEYMMKKKIDVPVIVISADIQETTRERVLALGASAIINKPPNKKELIDSILKYMK